MNHDEEAVLISILTKVTEMEQYISTFAPPKEVHKRLMEIRKLAYSILK